MLKPKVVHLGTPCTKMCMAGLREIDAATKAMNDLAKKILHYQSAIGLYASLENPKGSLSFTQTDWVKSFGAFPVTETAPNPGSWRHHELDGCQLKCIYPGDDDESAPHRKSRIWL